MRHLASIIVIAALAACASGAADGGGEREDLGRLPFPVERGSALPPPAPSATGAAPPEGAGPAGVDFGQWRSADPAAYGPAFQTQIRQRYAGQSEAHMRADLQANGFSCQESRFDCRIEIMERQCAYDWYVVLERGAAEPVAGFDQMCLGAN